MTDGDSDPFTGRTIAERYEIMNLLDAAGSSRVYKVNDSRDSLIRVLKLVRDFRDDVLDSFLLEAGKVKNQIKHPLLSQLYDFGVVRADEATPDFVYMVFDYLSGRSLFSLLNRQGRIELAEALPIFIQICDVSRHLHSAGLSGLSLSPRRIMISGTPEHPTAKLTECGLTSMLSLLSFDPQDSGSGSPFPENVLYLSPEQCAQQSSVDQRSDVYSMGCIMYECLVGLPPFLSKSPYEVSRMHINEEVKPLRMSRNDLNFPLELDLLVLKALRKNPHQRQQSMDELYEDLQHVQEQMAKVPEITPGAASKSGGLLAALSEDLADLIGIDTSLKVKLAVPVILGLVVIFGSIFVANILPQNLRSQDPRQAAEREAERQWQQLDMQAQRDFEHHDLAGAEDHYVKALKIAEKFGEDRRRLYGTLQKLQNIYMAQKRFDKSDEIEARMKSIMAEDAQ